MVNTKNLKRNWKTNKMETKKLDETDFEKTFLVSMNNLPEETVKAFEENTETEVDILGCTLNGHILEFEQPYVDINKQAVWFSSIRREVPDSGYLLAILAFAFSQGCQKVQFIGEGMLAPLQEFPQFDW